MSYRTSLLTTTGIGKGEYTKLKFGKQDKYLDSKDQLQHYIVV